MTRARDEQGRYAEEVSPDSVLEVFDEVEVPVLAATDIAEVLGCSRPTAYNKLEELVEEGQLRKKTVGARAVVYIRLSG